MVAVGNLVDLSRQKLPTLRRFEIVFFARKNAAHFCHLQNIEDFHSERNSAAEWSTNVWRLTHVKCNIPNPSEISGSVSWIFLLRGTCNVFSSLCGILDFKKKDFWTWPIKVTQYLRRCPLEKNSYAFCFKLWTVEFQINIHYIHIAFVKKLEAGKQMSTECYFAKSIGYQMQPFL